MSINSGDAVVKRGMKPWLRTLIFAVVFVGVFTLLAVPMGLSNMLNTLMNTAYRLIMDTTLYIMALAVIMGAMSALLTEYGVVALLDRLLAPLMRPLFGMPGAASLGIVTTYLSDNPAILNLADDMEYRRYFKAYQIPAITNLGTAFGMGLIVTTYMLGLSGKTGSMTGLAVLCGNIGAVVGSIISTRLMLRHTGKILGREKPAVDETIHVQESSAKEEAVKSRGILRAMDVMMEGGKKGVSLGLGIIPGVLIVCSLVMMFTNGPSADGSYTGAAYEGIGLLPLLADKLSFVIKPLFGFTSSECIAVPVTALGSAGASMGIVATLVQSGLAGCGDIAVFTAICMCWSGYLSTHISMMDVLKANRFTGRAILYHTIGGLGAGIAANWLFRLMQLIFG